MLQLNRYSKTRSAILALFTALLLSLYGVTTKAEENPAKTEAGDAAKTVAILPFEMHAPDSMAYMQEGLRDMLASRLAANAGVTIIENARIGELLKGPGKMLQQQEAAKLADELAADYIVSGSLTSLGGSVSIDAIVFPADKADEPKNFYASAPKENEAIGAINSLSWDIAADVFGANRPAHTVESKFVVPPAEDETMAAFRTAHPEKVFRSQGSLYGGGSSPLIMSRSTVGGFTKTQNLNFPLRSFDVGDVDGDGELDIVITETHKIYVYHLQNNRLFQFGSVEMPNFSKIHAVSLADLNGNGKAEIYASAADDYLPHSWAYEWDGSGLETILDDVPWYIRTVAIPGEGIVLAGQRGDPSSLLRTGIFRLMKDGSKVMAEHRIIMPDYINLFDFSLADITGDGAYEVVAINSANRLYVVRKNGYVLWVSDEYYSGTTRYLGEDYDQVGRTGLDLNSTHSSEVIGNEGSGKRNYLPSRLVIMDVNDDGISDVVLNKNPVSATRHFENYKSFKSGEIHAMTWNGLALTGIWRTKKIDGYISDLQLVPVPGSDRKAKLFVGLVLSKGWADSYTKSDSTILSYDVDISEEKEEKTPSSN